MTAPSLVGKHRHGCQCPASKGLIAATNEVQMVEPQPHAGGTRERALRTAMHTGGFEVKGEEAYRLRGQHVQGHRSLEGQDGCGCCIRDLGVRGGNKARRRVGPAC